MTKKTDSRLNGMRILAVDDERDILEVIQDVLDEASVDVASSHNEALDMLAENDYDLVILDIMGVNGLDLLSKTVDADIPTVMLTAHALNAKSLVASMAKGALCYLPKEELGTLDEALDGLLTAREQGNSTWEWLFKRLGGLFDTKFGRNWMAKYPEIRAQQGLRYWRP